MVSERNTEVRLGNKRSESKDSPLIPWKIEIITHQITKTTTETYQGERWRDIDNFGTVVQSDKKKFDFPNMMEKIPSLLFWEILGNIGTKGV